MPKARAAGCNTMAAAPIEMAQHLPTPNVHVTTISSPSTDVVAVLTVDLTGAAVFLPSTDEVEEMQRHQKRSLFQRLFGCCMCWGRRC